MHQEVIRRRPEAGQQCAATGARKLTADRERSTKTESPGANGIDVLWVRLRQHVTDGKAWLSLARCYAARNLTWQAAYAARQAVRCDAALASQLADLTAGQDANDGDALLGRSSLPEAATLAWQFSTQVAYSPLDWLTWLYLARLREMIGTQEAPSDASPQAGTPAATGEPTLQYVQRLEPVPGESLHWMGVWRLNAGNAQGAVAALSQLLDIRPVRTGSMMYLGEALLRIGNHLAAEKAFARASLSNNVEFLLTLSARVYAHNYWQEAIAVLRKALTLKPDSVPIWLALARIQSEVYLLADCRDSLTRIRELDADNQEARLLEAGLNGRIGDARAHLAILQRAYESGGDTCSRLNSSIAMTSLYHDGLTSTEIAALHRRMCAPIEAALQPKSRFTRTTSASSAARRLRIGYITADLHRQHPVNIFMLPILQRHDNETYEICIYHTGTMHDDCTRQAMRHAARWVEAAHLNDQALRQAIIDDGIDVLVDLAGHTANHRLGVFAMRAAPVQTTFLGYPHSTGLANMDWLIGDPTVSPAEHAHLYSEGIAQLPDSVFCWMPVDTYPLPPQRPDSSPLVLGSFNNAMKLSPATIERWARTLHALPQAQLLLKAPSLRDGAARAHFTAMFQQHGIGAERLLYRGPSGLAQMMQEYGDIDIALDPFPYNGGTTTLQALWMGVPVVTLGGSNFVSRMGSSFMRTLGKPEWVANDGDSYVDAIVQLASDPGTLRRGRSALRAQMALSPLCDIGAYTRHLEALYARMWRMHCDGDSQRILPGALPAGD